MEHDSRNWRRAAGGRYVVGHTFEAIRCKALWTDFRGRAEESRAVRRDNRRYSEGPGRARRQESATTLQYRTFIKEKSLYNTPPTFGIYIVGLVQEWIDAEGGVEGIGKRNDAKAKLLYDAIDASPYYNCPVEKDSRSKMNVVFRVAGGNEEIEKKFAKEGEAAGLIGIKGHRSVGGMRASIYNAVPLEAVQALVSFMARI